MFSNQLIFTIVKYTLSSAFHLTFEVDFVIVDRTTNDNIPLIITYLTDIGQ